MAMDKIGDGLKKFLLVGIGAAATTVEKLAKMSADELELLKKKIAEAEKAFEDAAGITESDEEAKAAAELDEMDDDIQKEGYMPADEEKTED